MVLVRSSGEVSWLSCLSSNGFDSLYTWQCRLGGDMNLIFSCVIIYLLRSTSKQSRHLHLHAPILFDNDTTLILLKSLNKLFKLFLIERMKVRDYLFNH